MELVMQRRIKLFKNQKGLTLIELLAVIVILGIIAAIAVPAISKTISHSRSDADDRSMEIIQEATLRYLMDTDPNGKVPSPTITTTLLQSSGYLNQVPTVQSDSSKSFTITASFTTTGGWSVTVTIS